MYIIDLGAGDFYSRSFCYFSMASFAARRLAGHREARAAWTVDECARFAALKEFELLRLLSTDKKEGAGDGSLRLVVWASLSHIRKSATRVQALPQVGLLRRHLAGTGLLPLTLRRRDRKGAKLSHEEA